jgi:hypothetical protein
VSESERWRATCGGSTADLEIDLMKILRFVDFNTHPMVNTSPRLAFQDYPASFLAMRSSTVILVSIGDFDILEDRTYCCCFTSSDPASPFTVQYMAHNQYSLRRLPQTACARGVVCLRLPVSGTLPVYARAAPCVWCRLCVCACGVVCLCKSVMVR